MECVNESLPECNHSGGNYSVEWPLEMDVTFYYYFYKVVVPVLFGMISCVGLVGNSLVIFVIFSETKMRTTVNLLLLNLAFSDVIFLLICVPFVTYHYVADNWLVGDVTCKLSQFLLYVTVYVTVYTLVAISTVRYLAVVYAHKSTRIRTKRNICVVVGVIWAIMLVVNIPIILIYRVKEYELDKGTMEPYKYCGMEDKRTGQKIFLSFFFLTYIIPLSFICTFYMLLLRYLRLQRKGSSIKHNRRSNGRSREKTAFASKILIVVVAVFGVCWLPLHTHLLVSYFGVQPKATYYEVFRVLCHCLAYSNSMMNPLIYNYVSKDFRKSFHNFYHQYLCCRGPVETITSENRGEEMKNKNSFYSVL